MKKLKRITVKHQPIRDFLRSHVQYTYCHSVELGIGSLVIASIAKPSRVFNAIFDMMVQNEDSNK